MAYAAYCDDPASLHNTDMLKGSARSERLAENYGLEACDHRNFDAQHPARSFQLGLPICSVLGVGISFGTSFGKCVMHISCLVYMTSITIQPPSAFSWKLEDWHFSRLGSLHFIPISSKTSHCKNAQDPL